MRVKSGDFYRLKVNVFVEYFIDFDWFLENLKKKNEFSDQNANKFLF